MKRYLVFAFPHFYAAGGWHDFLGSADTMDEAKAILDSRSDKVLDSFAHIVDAETGEMFGFCNTARYVKNPGGWVAEDPPPKGQQ